MSEIPLGDFGPAKCALGAFVQPGCQNGWEKWCRYCNCVFCAAHVEPPAHRCPKAPESLPGALQSRPKCEPITDKNTPPIVIPPWEGASAPKPGKRKK